MRYISIESENSVVVKAGELSVRKPGCALLRLLYGGICGSDLATYRGSFLYSTYPRIPDHEFSAHTVKRLKVQPGEKVMVAGGGTTGLFAAMAAKLFRGEVTCCYISQAKLDVPRRLGMQTVHNTGGDAFSRQVEELTKRNGFDVCIEAAGELQTFLDCIDAAAYRVRVAVVGVSKKAASFLPSLIQKKKLDVLGSRNAQKEDFLEVIDLFKKGTVDPTLAISAIYDIKEAPRAFAETVAAGDRIKVMLSF